MELLEIPEEEGVNLKIEGYCTLAPSDNIIFTIGDDSISQFSRGIVLKFSENTKLYFYGGESITGINPGGEKSYRTAILCEDTSINQSIKLKAGRKICIITDPGYDISKDISEKKDKLDNENPVVEEAVRKANEGAKAILDIRNMTFPM